MKSNVKDSDSFETIKSNGNAQNIEVVKQLIKVGLNIK